jgi:hypothetical protein
MLNVHRNPGGHGSGHHRRDSEHRFGVFHRGSPFFSDAEEPCIGCARTQPKLLLGILNAFRALART